MNQDNRVNQPYSKISLGIFDKGVFRKSGKPLIDDLIHSARTVKTTTNTKMNDGINERLKIERKRAMEVLQNSQQACSIMNGNKQMNYSSDKENSSSKHHSPNTNTNKSRFNHTDYVPYQRNDSVNISDLVTNETIHLRSMTSERLSNAINFEPIEITGRSTQYNGNNNSNNQSTTVGNYKAPPKKKSKAMSVSEILATSFAPKARNLCETLNNVNNTINDTMGNESQSQDYNDSQNLLRTADISLLQDTFDYDVNGHYKFGTSDVSITINNDNFSKEHFTPGELMNSRLLSDEISWANEYATIPTKALSNQAKQKVKQGVSTDDNFNLTSTSNLTLPDTEFSIGSFFNKRSENINNIIQSKSPISTLSTEEVGNRNSTEREHNLKAYNKTYTRASLNDVLLPLEDDDETRSLSRKSFAESLSALDRALNKLQLDSPSMEVKISKKQSSGTVVKQPATNKNAAMDNASNVSENLWVHKTVSLSANILRDILLENKENIDPKFSKSKTADNNDENNCLNSPNSVESQANCSDIKVSQRQSLQVRSPLSPISTNGSLVDVEINDNEIENKVQVAARYKNHDEAIDEQENTTKQKTIKNLNFNSTSAQSTAQIASVSKPKSLSSTRLEFKKANAFESGTRTSPINAKNSKAMSTITTTLADTPALLDSKACCSSSNNKELLTVPTLVIREDSPTSFGEGISPITSPSLGSNDSPNTRRSLNNHLNAATSTTSPSNSVASSGCTYRSGGTIASSISRCSSTSEFCFRDGNPLPIKVTTTELSWVSTKLRTNSKKSFQIKNTSDKRLVFRLEIHGPGFQLVNNQRSINLLTLHSQECRTITVNFCPTVQGVAIGCISFYAPISNKQPAAAKTAASSLLDIPLYGYGGHSRIQLTGILKGPIGAPYLPMGQLCDLRQSPLERSIIIHNRGILPAFCYVNIDSVGLVIQHLGDAFDIHPQKVIIPPGDIVKVRLVFHPKREDIKKITKKISDVLTVANLRVIYGDEADRQRILRLMEKLTEAQHSYISSHLFHPLWTTFPGEIPMTDLNDVNECSDAAMDLFTNLHLNEIAITIDHQDVDETQLETSSFLSDVDETVLFRTICVPQYNTQEQHTEVRKCTERIDKKDGNWSIEPKLLDINLRTDHSAFICIHSNFNSTKHFKITCDAKNNKNIVQLKPNEGYIPPGNNETTINITFNSGQEMLLNENIVLTIKVENERVNVPVNVRH